MNRTFIFGHWILTLIFGPIFLILNSYLSNSSGSNLLAFIELFPLMVMMGFMFSIPTYLFLILIISIIKDKNIKTLYTRALLILTIVAGTWITTNIIGGTLWSDIAIAYSLSAIIVGIFLKSNFNFPWLS